MGLGKWWLTHGPGSPGATAKAMAKNYIKLKKEDPLASKEELLMLSLLIRNNTYERLGLPTLSVEEQEEIVRNSEKKLSNLVLYVIHLENPAASEAMINSPDLYSEMQEVIEEVISKYASGA